MAIDAVNVFYLNIHSTLYLYILTTSKRQNGMTTFRMEIHTSISAHSFSSILLFLLPNPHIHYSDYI